MNLFVYGYRMCCRNLLPVLGRVLECCTHVVGVGHRLLCSAADGARGRAQELHAAAPEDQLRHGHAHHRWGDIQ